MKWDDASSAAFGRISRISLAPRAWLVCLVFCARRKMGRALRLQSSYRSESSLYPVQLCVFVKPDRVDGLEGGVYRFDPVENTLLCSGEPIVFDAKQNSSPQPKHVRRDAAFVIFVVGHVERIASLFGAQSEHLP